jgi:hypothetical protein
MIKYVFVIAAPRGPRSFFSPLGFRVASSVEDERAKAYAG